MKALLLAAMPMVLMKGTAPDPDHWLRIEPAIVAAVECRQALALRVLDGIAPNAPGSWSLTPARSFTAFGLPVKRIELLIDPDGELGASYTAVIGERSQAQVRKQLALAKQGGRIGQLSADQSSAEVQVSCTVPQRGKGEHPAHPLRRPDRRRPGGAGFRHRPADSARRLVPGRPTSR